jgi:hypothetical protein
MKFLNISNQSNWQSPKLPAHKAGEVIYEAFNAHLTHSCPAPRGLTLWGAGL